MGCILNCSVCCSINLPWLLGVCKYGFLAGTSGDIKEVGGSYWDHLNYGGVLLFPP
jgi:hypothetical protein